MGGGKRIDDHGMTPPPNGTKIDTTLNSELSKSRSEAIVFRMHPGKGDGGGEGEEGVKNGGGRGDGKLQRERNLMWRRNNWPCFQNMGGGCVCTRSDSNYVWQTIFPTAFMLWAASSRT